MQGEVSRPLRPIVRAVRACEANTLTMLHGTHASVRAGQREASEHLDDMHGYIRGLRDSIVCLGLAVLLVAVTLGVHLARCH